MASEQSLDTQLAALRAAEKSLREQRPSWFEHIFHPGRQARRQEDFSRAAVETLKEIIASIRNSTAKFAEKEGELAELREDQRESAGTIQTLADRAAEMRQQFEQLAREHSEKIEQVVASHGDLGNELRAPIQPVR